MVFFKNKHSHLCVLNVWVLYHVAARQTLVTAAADTPRVIAICAAVEDRTARLAGLVSIDLANPVANKMAVQANIDMLLRLDLGDQVNEYLPSSS